MNNFSKFGFILATLGSSIGLGHIWRFPYLVGNNGGGAFVLMFLFLTLVIGVSMLVGEMLIGNKTNKNAFDAFKELDSTKNKTWRFAGLTLIGGPIILTFYTIILGWVLYYLFVVSFDLPNNIQEANITFDELVGHNLTAQILGFSAVLWLTALIISLGVKEGIERLNLVLMPLLFIIFAGLLVYCFSLDSFGEAFKFLFSFKFQDLNASTIVQAMGQMCFSLSLGIGIVITYAASSNKNQNLLTSSLWITLSGIVIALIAGLIIFTFVFEYGVMVQEGAGLAFKSLPIAFSKMGFLGIIISILFFISLAFAGLTSTISLLEPSILFLIEKFKWSRKFSSFIVSLLIYMVGIMLILSLNVDYSASLSVFGKSLFGAVDALSSSFIMPFGALIYMIFIGFFIGKEKMQNLTGGFLSNTSFNVWFFIIRFVAPLVIIVAWIGIII